MGWVGPGGGWGSWPGGGQGGGLGGGLADGGAGGAGWGLEWRGGWGLGGGGLLASRVFWLAGRYVGLLERAFAQSNVTEG